MSIIRDLSEEDAAALGIADHPGYFGAFTRRHAPGAIPNDTPVWKVNSEEGDRAPDGTIGVVLGSIIGFPFVEYMYFVEWLSQPKVSVAVIGRKISREAPP